MNLLKSNRIILSKTTPIRGNSNTLNKMNLLKSNRIILSKTTPIRMIHSRIRSKAPSKMI
ncbi:hypothetical protein BAMEG_5017 [Bacillus anthracis str. CDC 684]|nr:hypothetical protein BAMEG_5017 [Bacillus anthracis str. CDC 684]